MIVLLMVRNPTTNQYEIIYGVIGPYAVQEATTLVQTLIPNPFKEISPCINGNHTRTIVYFQGVQK